MKKSLIIVLSFLFCLCITTNAQDDHKGHNQSSSKKEKVTEKSTEAKDKTKVEVVNSVCPVSGEDLEDYDHTITHKGKTYAVCCKKCLKKIKADPEKYISRLSDDGKSLKKS